MLLRAVASIVLFTSTLAYAQPTALPTTEESDRDRAANHAHVAQLLYARGDYAGALKEFETARSILAVPELDFDLGKCLEHLGRNAEAADAYERYVVARPDDPNNDERRAHIAELRKIATAPPVAANVIAADRPKRPSPVAPAVVAGFTGLSLVVAAGLVGHVGADLAKRADGCCSQSLADGLRR